MIELETPRFDIGDHVYVLSRHRDWHTPSLSLALVERIVWSVDGVVSYRLAGWNGPDRDSDKIVKMFSVDDELEAKAEFCSM